MTDYSRLIDEETWAFIRHTESYYPPDTIDATIERQREIYDAMCREFFAGYPDGVVAEDRVIEANGLSVPTRHYKLEGANPSVLILYFHGGGFVVGGLESHDDVCAEICARTGNRVVSVDYRLAPEHIHPAAFDDCLAAFEWAGGDTGLPILLAGDSAGGNLAACVSHATRDHPRKPVGQLLIYPGLGGDPQQGSYVAHAEAPMLTMRDLVFYRDIRSGGVDVSRDVTATPLADTTFSGLPRTIAIGAECDPLCDDAQTYAEALNSAGGEAMWHVEAGLVHGHLRARHTVTRARDAFTRVIEGLEALADPGKQLPDWK